jgi:serine protease Do
VIRGFKPGDVVDVDVMRFGQKKTFKVKLAEPADDPTTVAQNDEDDTPAPSRDNTVSRPNDRLGITVGPISSDFATSARLKGAAAKGVRVLKVAGNGPAYKQLIENDIIISELFPAKRDIRSVADLDQALSSVKNGDVIELLVCAPTQQGCQTRAVSLQVGK